MSLNWKEIDLVLSELNITKGKIQQVLQPTPHQLFLEIYTPQPSLKSNEVPSLHFIYISLENGKVRMHTCSHRIKKPKNPQRFQQLLQSRIIGMHIDEIIHINHDRIIKIVLSKHRAQQHLHLNLYIRLWSNHANILLTDVDNNIVDLAFRRPQQQLMPKHIYTPEINNNPKKEVNIRIWDKETYTTFNDYIEFVYTQQSSQIRKEHTLQKYLQAYNKQKYIIQQSLEKVDEQLSLNALYKELENYGNIILNNLDNISESQKILEITNLNSTQEHDTVKIPLDSNLSPSENAEKYFNLAKKQKRSIQILTKQKSALLMQIDSLKEIQTLLEDEKTSISEKQKLLLFPKHKQSQKSKPQQRSQTFQIKVLLQDGPYTIMIGRNVKENDTLLRKVVKGNDIWLHIRGHSGAYVFIRSPKNKTVSLEMLKTSGQLAAMFSKAKNEAYADIYYTPVKHLKRVKGNSGLVTPIRDKNLQIKIDIPAAKKYLREHSI